METELSKKSCYSLFPYCTEIIDNKRVGTLCINPLFGLARTEGYPVPTPATGEGDGERFSKSGTLRVDKKMN